MFTSKRGLCSGAVVCDALMWFMMIKSQLCVPWALERDVLCTWGVSESPWGRVTPTHPGPHVLACGVTEMGEGMWTGLASHRALQGDAGVHSLTCVSHRTVCPCASAPAFCCRPAQPWGGTAPRVKQPSPALGGHSPAGKAARSLARQQCHSIPYTPTGELLF